MVSLKKYIACKCGASNSFEFNSNMDVEEISVTARCPSCGASVNISVSSMLASPKKEEAPAFEMAGLSAISSAQDAIEASVSSETETQENVEQAVRDLFR